MMSSSSTTTSTGNKRRRLEDTDRNLYCTCKQPNDPAKPMVQCEFCDEWFHLGCIDMDEEDIRNCGHWFCSGCIAVKQQDPFNAIKGFSGFQGRSAPKDGWSNAFELEDLDEEWI